EGTDRRRVQEREGQVRRLEGQCEGHLHGGSQGRQQGSEGRARGARQGYGEEPRRRAEGEGGSRIQRRQGALRRHGGQCQGRVQEGREDGVRSGQARQARQGKQHEVTEQKRGRSLPPSLAL